MADTKLILPAERVTELAGSSGLTPAQVEVLWRSIGAELGPDEFAAFLWLAKARGLNPLTREIYAWARDGRVTHYVGIDGALRLADASGEYRGCELSWCSGDGLWRDVWLSGKPAAARAIIYRRDWEPQASVASWAEYGRSGSRARAWEQYPSVMLAKCALMIGLRRAFPAALGGLYVPEEMHSEPPPAGAIDTTSASPPSQVLIESPAAVIPAVIPADRSPSHRLWTRIRERWPEEQRKDIYAMIRNFQEELDLAASSSEWSEADCDDVWDLLVNHVRPRENENEVAS